MNDLNLERIRHRASNPQVSGLRGGTCENRCHGTRHLRASVSTSRSIFVILRILPFSRSQALTVITFVDVVNSKMLSVARTNYCGR